MPASAAAIARMAAGIAASAVAIVVAPDLFALHAAGIALESAVSVHVGTLSALAGGGTRPPDEGFAHVQLLLAEAGVRHDRLSPLDALLRIRWFLDTSNDALRTATNAAARATFEELPTVLVGFVADQRSAELNATGGTRDFAVLLTASHALAQATTRSGTPSAYFPALGAAS